MNGHWRHSMDELIKQLTVAIQSRDLIARLPNGLRQHAEQYEKMIINDIKALRAQLGDNTQVAPLIKQVKKEVVQSFIVPFLKKHFPTATIAGTVSILIQFVAQYLQK